MIIKTLKLENYRRFANLQLEFPENVIGILGRNGAGKSTIIEAIGWTLYGNLLARTEKQDIRSQFAPNNGKCSAEMEFVYGGGEYRIVRTLKGKNATSEAAVYRCGESEAVAVQDRGVNQFIEDLLKLDRQSFLTSVFARQKDLAALSSMKPEERRKSINRLINIDRIDKARDRVRRDRNEKKAFIDGMRATLKDLDVLQNEKKKIQKTISEKNDAKSKIEEQVSQQVAKLEKAKKSFEAQNRLRDQFLHGEAQLGKLQSRLQENQNSLQRFENDLQEILAAEKELGEIRKKLVNFPGVKNEHERLDRAATDYARLQGKRKEKELIEATIAKEENRCSSLKEQTKELKSLEKSLAELKIKQESLEAEIEHLREESKKSHGEQQAAMRSGKEVKQKLERIRELGPEGECPVCTQQLRDHYKQVTVDLEKQLQELRAEYQQHGDAEKRASAQLKELEKELGHSRSLKEDLLKKLSRAQEAAQNLEKAQDSLENYHVQLLLVQKELDEMGKIDYDAAKHHSIKMEYNELLKVKEKAAQFQERASRKAQVQADIERMERTIGEIACEQEEVKYKQAALGFSEENYSRVKNQVDILSRNLDATKEELSGIREELAGLKKEKEKISREISEQKSLRKEIENEKEAVDYLNALDVHLGKFRLELASRIRPLIAHRASELLALTTSSRYNLIDLDEDYNIHIYDGNASFRIERFSGGEQDLANLCLRIAISQVVAERSGGAPINFIVLDEIFGSQDSERRDLILNALAQLSSQFRQIFIITHIEQIKDMLPVIIDVTAKDGEESVAKVI
ncbi:MAG: AAA family ATPase [Actinobacteria bacterium]|nr:AAA family ATPase [Actinomycetota bacterium]